WLSDAREQHHSAQGGLFFGDHRRDYRTLAVAENPEAVSPDLRPGAQVCQTGTDILGKISTGRSLMRTTGRSGSTVIHAKHGDADTPECVRDLSKGQKTRQPDVLVAVFRSGSRDGDDRPDGLQLAS